MQAEKNGAFEKIVKCMRKFSAKSAVKEQCLKTMSALVQGYPDIVTQEGITLLSAVLDEVALEIISPLNLFKENEMIYFYYQGFSDNNGAARAGRYMP